jgi:hypothetical protein
VKPHPFLVYAALGWGALLLSPSAPALGASALPESIQYSPASAEPSPATPLLERLGALFREEDLGELDLSRSGRLALFDVNQAYVDPNLASGVFLKLDAVPSDAGVRGRVLGFEGMFVVHDQTASGRWYLLVFVGMEEARAARLAGRVSDSARANAAWSWLMPEAQAAQPAGCEPGVAYPGDGQVPMLQDVTSALCSSPLRDIAQNLWPCLASGGIGAVRGAGGGFTAVYDIFRHGPVKFLRGLKDGLFTLARLVTDFEGEMSRLHQGYCAMEPPERARLLCGLFAEVGTQFVVSALTAGAGTTLLLKKLMDLVRKSPRTLILTQKALRKVNALKVGPLRVERSTQELRAITAKAIGIGQEGRFIKSSRQLWYHFYIHQKEVKAFMHALRKHPVYGPKYFPNLTRRTTSAVGGTIHDMEKLTNPGILNGLWKFFGKNEKDLPRGEALEFRALKERLNSREHARLESYFKRRKLMDRKTGEKLPEALQAERAEKIADLVSRESAVAAEEMGKTVAKPADAFLESAEDIEMARWLRENRATILKGEESYLERILGKPVPLPPLRSVRGQ